MNENLNTTINAAIALEYALAKLYEYYGKRFPDQYSFWSQMQIEEINHASLLKTVKDFAKIDRIPEDIILDDVSKYKSTIQKINNHLNEESIPDLNAAFEFAYSIEKTSGEIHFQHVLTKKNPDTVTKIFMQLNGQDLHHASRILEHWRTAVMQQ